MKTRRISKKILLLVNLTLILFLSLTYTNLITVKAQDTTPPTITIISPESTTYSGSEVDLNFTVNEEPSWTGYSLNGASNLTIDGNITLSLTDGTHTIVVYANDTSQNTGKSDTITFTISISPPLDFTPPVLTILSPTFAPYSTTTIDLRFTKNEATSWIGYSLDDAANITISGNTTISITEGPHTIVVYANDTSQNTGKSNTITFTILAPPPVDSIPPIVTVLSPTSTTYITNDVDLNFTVNEATSWIGYCLDGLNNVTITGNTKISINQGSHNITLYATDLTDNTGKSNTINFTISIPPVDNTSPTIIVLSPESKIYSVSEVDLNFTVNEAISWMGYSLDGASNLTIAGNTTLSLTDGTHTIVVYANDTSQNTGKSNTITFTILLGPIESIPPRITVLSPISKTYSTNEIELNFTINKETSWIGYSLDGTNNVTITGNTTLTLNEGTHNITVYATDLAEKNNFGKSAEIVFNVDSKAPVIIVSSPTSMTYNTNNVSLIVIVDEEASQKYSLDANNNVTFVNSTVLYGLSKGEHTIIIYAEDSYGNVVATEPLIFSVDYKRPLQPLEIAIAGLIFGVGLMLIFYFGFKENTNNRLTKN